MNKALLQTYVRSSLSDKPQTAEDIWIKLRDLDPKVTPGRIQIILNQLYKNGLCGAGGHFSEGPNSFFILKNKTF